MKMEKVLVTGASGLVGGYLVQTLLDDGFIVRAVGRKPIDEWKQSYSEAENISLDLSLRKNCLNVMDGIDIVYNLAAEIGGVKFIEKHKAQTMLSVLINTHLLIAARDAHVSRYFYASTNAVASAEAPQDGKSLTEVIGDGHVWEKLFSEKLCKYFNEDFGLSICIGRLQNVYGEFDKYDGGLERAPAALCRKAVIAKHTANHKLEIWGDGTQTRSFVYVKDAVAGIRKLVESNISDPVLIGNRKFVSINRLVDFVEKASGVKFIRKYNAYAPQGTSRILPIETLADKKFNWTPTTSLEIGIKSLYDWVEQDMKNKGKILNS